MRLGAAALLAALLAATYQDSCAPWDGAALAIAVDSLGLRVRLYGGDIAKFENGDAVTAERSPAPEGSSAEIWGRSGKVPYVRAEAKLRMDPKTGKGFVTVDGTKTQVRFKKVGTAPPRCG